MTMEYEESIAFLGQCGRFQLITLFLLCVKFLQNGVSTFSIVFVGAVTSHHCLVPEVGLTQVWHNAAIPVQMVDGRQELSRCSRYKLDLVRNLSAQGLVPGRDVNLTDLEQEGCVDGWSYNRDVYQSTVVTEFDLVCSDQWKQPFTSTVYFLGLLFGSFVSGPVADRYGRKPVLIATTILQTVFTVAERFSPTWTVFCILFFLTGFSQISNYTAAFVLGTEILTGEVQVLFSSLGANVWFAFGYMMIPLFAYFLRDWKNLVFVLSLPGFVFIPIWWFISESPRWLLSVGRVEEAETIVRRIAKFNKVQPPPVTFEGYGPQHKETKIRPQKHCSVLCLVKSRNIRHTTLIVCLVWVSIRIGYNGLSLNTAQLHADPYISCFLSALVEVPAYVFTWLALKYIPRRLTTVCILVTAALSLYFIQLVPESLSYLAVAMEILGKFAVSAGAALMYIYTAELYPTVIRNTGTGTCNALARVGSCIAPFLLNLSIYSEYLPQTIIATFSILSAFAVFFLPETFKRPLPQTINEMAEGKSLKCLFNPGKKRPAPGVVTGTRL